MFQLYIIVMRCIIKRSTFYITITLYINEHFLLSVMNVGTLGTKSRAPSPKVPIKFKTKSHLYEAII